MQRLIYVFFMVIIFLTGCARTGYHGTLTTPPQVFDFGAFAWPAEGAVRRPAPDDPMKRKGIWIGVSPNGAVKAAQSGTVSFFDSEFSGYGKTMIIEHSPEYATVYAGLGTIFVSPGDRVQRGQIIATVAQDRSEIYFEVRKNAATEDSLAFLSGRASESS